ncbi:MAG: hypothetical protein H6661_11140 [Ardenticatenaceae bacterium]|nr:hypothetical protein [Ardenticatenaceae bacterium]
MANGDPFIFGCGESCTEIAAGSLEAKHVIATGRNDLPNQVNNSLARASWGAGYPRAQHTDKMKGGGAKEPSPD